MIKLIPIGFILLMSLGAQANYDVSAEAQFDDNVIVLNDDLRTQDREYFYNFGRVRVNRTASTVFYLRNQGRTPIYINDIDANGSGFKRNDNCSNFLFSGQSCRIRVSFRPTHPGRYEGELEVELTGAEDIRVELRGRGVNRNGGWN